MIGASVERASKNLRARELTPLPEKVTPRSLRRTFASILYAIGEDPGVVMDEMGHTDPALALRVYRQSMRREGGAACPCRRRGSGMMLGIGGPHLADIRRRPPVRCRGTMESSGHA